MSAEQASINLNRKIQSVRIVDNVQCSEIDAQEDERFQKAAVSQAAAALNNAALKLRQFYDDAFVRYKEDIAKLSVEIARRVLAVKIRNGDYKIEEIIKDALAGMPAGQALEIHLNPADLEQCKNTIEGQLSCPAGYTVVPDANIGRAECMIKGAKGITESFIDVHLEKISESLMKACRI
jgi:flagellar biosynthesis/type III secretory pathway protein FliH